MKNRKPTAGAYSAVIICAVVMMFVFFVAFPSVSNRIQARQAFRSYRNYVFESGEGHDWNYKEYELMKEYYPDEQTILFGIEQTKAPLRSYSVEQFTPLDDADYYQYLLRFEDPSWMTAEEKAFVQELREKADAAAQVLEWSKQEPFVGEPAYMALKSSWWDLEYIGTVTRDIGEGEREYECYECVLTCDGKDYIYKTVLTDGETIVYVEKDMDALSAYNSALYPNGVSVPKTETAGSSSSHSASGSSHSSSSGTSGNFPSTSGYTNFDDYYDDYSDDFADFDEAEEYYYEHGGK